MSMYDLADRVEELIKRNIKLEIACDRLLGSLKSVSISIHDAMNHEGSFADCLMESCGGLKKLISIHEAEDDKS